MPWLTALPLTSSQFTYLIALVLLHHLDDELLLSVLHESRLQLRRLG